MTGTKAAPSRLYLSDLHLVEPTSVAFQTLRALLQVEAPNVQSVYFLGDLCETWIGDDDDGPLASALAEALAQAAAHCEVFVMHGNRDFLLGEAFAKRCGCRLIDDPLLLDDGTLLSHGDRFCTEDHEYQQLRSVLRSEEWQASVLRQTLAERRALARSLRAESQAANANKAENIMDAAETEIEREMLRHKAHTLIHGHTHRPGVHAHPSGHRFVLGAWERCGWLVRQAGSQHRLECFALTGRYESAAQHLEQ